MYSNQFKKIDSSGLVFSHHCTAPRAVGTRVLQVAARRAMSSIQRLCWRSAAPGYRPIPLDAGGRDAEASEVSFCFVARCAAESSGVSHSSAGCWRSTVTSCSNACTGPGIGCTSDRCSTGELEPPTTTTLRRTSPTTTTGARWWPPLCTVPVQTASRRSTVALAMQIDARRRSRTTPTAETGVRWRWVGLHAAAAAPPPARPRFTATTRRPRRRPRSLRPTRRYLGSSRPFLDVDFELSWPTTRPRTRRPGRCLVRAHRATSPGSAPWWVVVYSLACRRVSVPVGPAAEQKPPATTTATVQGKTSQSSIHSWLVLFVRQTVLLAISSVFMSCVLFEHCFIIELFHLMTASLK